MKLEKVEMEGGEGAKKEYIIRGESHSERDVEEEIKRGTYAHTHT